MKKFMIAYAGREGSSAIISLLGKQSGVVVPVFEDIDKQNYKKYFRPEDVTLVLDYIYRTGRFDPAEIRSLISNRNSLARMEDVSLPFIVGLKWRPFEEKRAVAVLTEHDVTVGYLCRRDFSELVCSLYITSSPEFGDKFDMDAGERHPQFRMKRMAAAAQEAFLSRLDDLRIEADRERFLAGARQVLKSRSRLVRRLTVFRDEGVIVGSLFYEDFLDNNEGFIGRFLATLGSPREEIESSTRFTKVMRQPAAEKVVNFAEISCTAEFEDITGEYATLLAQFAPLLPSNEIPLPTTANTARSVQGRHRDPAGQT